MHIYCINVHWALGKNTPKYGHRLSFFYPKSVPHPNNKSTPCEFYLFVLGDGVYECFDKKFLWTGNVCCIRGESGWIHWVTSRGKLYCAKKCFFISFVLSHLRDCAPSSMSKINGNIWLGSRRPPLFPIKGNIQRCWVTLKISGVLHVIISVILYGIWWYHIHVF